MAVIPTKEHAYFRHLRASGNALPASYLQQANTELTGFVVA